MTNPREPDGRLEDLLRNALAGEADTVSPAGDGLSRIQQRVAASRGRRMWLRPVAVVGGAAVAAAAGFTAYAVTSQPDGSDSVLNKQPPVIPATQITTPTATPSKSAAPPVAPAFPTAAFYPFTSASAERSWEAQKGPAAQPWIVSPVDEAKRFISSYVLAGGVSQVMGSHIGTKTAAVTLGRTITDGSSGHPVKVTTVRMQRFGKAWLVVGADDPNANLKVSSPGNAAPVASPLTVSGPAYGVDESVSVAVRAIGAPFLTATPAHTSFGNGSGTWSTSVAFGRPADPRGAVVVVSDSAADGGPGRIVVTGVTFAGAQTGYPAYFYGVKNGRVTKFSARTGAAISYLTPPAPGGGASDPQLVGDQVYFLSGAGTCANTLMSVPVSGGTPTQVASPDAGYVISGYSVSQPKVNTFYETACAPGVTPAARLVINTLTGDTHQATTKTNFTSVPPGIVADPTWDSDGQHLDAILRSGTQSHLARYNGYGNPSSPNDNAVACSGFPTSSNEPLAAEIDANGYLWVATRTGSSMQVVRCIGNTPRVMFTVAGNRQPADIDVAGSGTAVLLTDTTGKVWRWNDGGGVTQLSSVPVTQLTW